MRPDIHVSLFLHAESQQQREGPDVPFARPLDSQAGTQLAGINPDHQQGESTMPTQSGHTRAIRANKVIGTSVKNAAGESIGKVEDVVLDKQSNNIMYAVVGFGGFLGMGEKYHPIPWSTLNYDDGAGAYIVNFTKEQLKSAPADSLDELTKGDGSAYRDRTFDYYKAPRYW